MSNDEIKRYDELNTDEHAVLDAFREMKIGYDKARIELINYRINDIINSYDELQKLREDIRLNYFEVLQKINEEEFADVILIIKNGKMCLIMK